MIPMIVQWSLAALLLISSLGVILAQNPVHACLAFLLTLLSLAILYLQLAAQFIAVMQILVYGGAILVIFMFVIVLFQDAHQQIERFKAKSSPWFLWCAGLIFALTCMTLGLQLSGLTYHKKILPSHFGTVESLGQALYIDFFFPFEAVILLFLVALIGALYIGKKVR